MNALTSIPYASNTLASKAKSDYNHIRFQARLNRFHSTISKKPAELLSFNAIKASGNFEGPTYLGTRSVEIDCIIGSLDRYKEFDRSFKPLYDYTTERWISVDLAYYQGITLPPVVLYKIGECYFVLDGHHRISVSKKHGQAFIDAEIYEFTERSSTFS